MIPILRVVLGWLFLGACVFAMWRQASTWVTLALLAAGLLTHGGIGSCRPVVLKTDEQRAHEVVFAVVLIFAFLIGAFTQRDWLCWLVLGVFLAVGMSKDLWLLARQRPALGDAKHTN